MSETKVPMPWDTPGVPPTDAAAQEAAAEAARQAAIVATGTPGTALAPIGAASPDSSAASGMETASDVTVTVTVPKPFVLRLASKNGDIAHHEFKYAPGVQEMLLSHAEHWWAKANGVVVYKKS